jgi:hypothetical protein
MGDSAGLDAQAVAARCGELEEALAAERAKNEALLEQVLKAEDSLVDKEVESFSDVIPNDDRAFWRGQLLENREAATGILTRMRSRVSAQAPGVAPVLPKPLHNRETSKVGAAGSVGSGGGTPAPASADRAAKLRNRAQEIARRDGCSFTAAFRAAEQDVLA